MLRPAWPLLLAALAVPLVLAALAPHASATAIIDNGVVQIGVYDNGELNAPGGTPTPSSTCGSAVTIVGIRYLPTGCDGISPGCECEGWGAAYTMGATTESGYANKADTTMIPCGGVSSTTVLTASEATVETPICDLLVTHDFHPSADTANLYEVTVTMENRGAGAMTNVLYRRVMDWDIQPTNTDEYVTIQADSSYAGPWPAPAGTYPAPLLRTWDNGFAPADPLSSPTTTIDAALCRLPPSAPWVESIPNKAPLVDNGPCDHGALFDFNFGTLAPGQRFSFHIYYGAAGNEPDAMAALADVGAQLWSLGQCSNSDCGPGTGNVNTFVFAFAGIVPIPPPPPPNDKPIADADLTIGTTCEDSSVLFDAAKSVDPDGTLVSYAWDFGDGKGASGKLVDHTYALPGSYTATLTVTDNMGATASKGFAIESIGDPNCCPTLDPVPDILAMELDPIGFLATANDFEGGPLGFTLLPLPHGSIFDGIRGTFEWETQPGDAGVYAMVLSVNDGACIVQHPVLITVQPLPEPLPTAPDFDQDGRADDQDNCPGLPNGAQEDTDLDGLGDVCDPDPGVATDPVTVRSLRLGATRDRDRDGIADAADVCPGVPDRGQEDMDGDRIGDACDPDLDGDGVVDQATQGAFADNCRLVSNADQADRDGDGVGDACASGMESGARAAPAGDAEPGVFQAATSPVGSGAKVFALAFAAAGLLGLLVVLVVVRRQHG